MTLFWVVVGGGCSSLSGPGAAEVASAFEQTSPDCRLDRESRIALGGLKMSAVKALVKLSGEDDAAELLGSMRRVEVTTYRVSGFDSCGEIFGGTFVGEGLATEGWRPIVRERGRSGRTWVFERESSGGEIDALFVVALDSEELEVLRLEGEIDKLMVEAMKADTASVEQFVEFAR